MIGEQTGAEPESREAAPDALAESVRAALDGISAFATRIEGRLADIVASFEARLGDLRLEQPARPEGEAWAEHFGAELATVRVELAAVLDALGPPGELAALRQEVQELRAVVVGREPGGLAGLSPLIAEVTTVSDQLSELTATVRQAGSGAARADQVAELSARLGDFDGAGDAFRALADEVAALRDGHEHMVDRLAAALEEVVREQEAMAQASEAGASPVLLALDELGHGVAQLRETVAELVGVAQRPADRTATNQLRADVAAVAQAVEALGERTGAVAAEVTALRAAEAPDALRSEDLEVLRATLTSALGGVSDAVLAQLRSLQEQVGTLGDQDVSQALREALGSDLESLRKGLGLVAEHVGGLREQTAGLAAGVAALREAEPSPGLTPADVESLRAAFATDLGGVVAQFGALQQQVLAGMEDTSALDAMAKRVADLGAVLGRVAADVAAVRAERSDAAKMARLADEFVELRTQQAALAYGEIRQLLERLLLALGA